MLKFVRSIHAVGIGLSLVALSGAAVAKPHEPKAARVVPEINGAVAGAGLALVLGGAAVVLGRRRRKAG